MANEIVDMAEKRKPTEEPTYHLERIGGQKENDKPTKIRDVKEIIYE